MSRRTLIVLILLGAAALWWSTPRQGSPPPDRPLDERGIEMPGVADGTGGARAGEGDLSAEEKGEARTLRGRVVTGEEGETPVPGARVFAWGDPEQGYVELWLPSPDAPEPAPAVAESLAAKDGRFVLRVPAGTPEGLLLVARAEGYRDGFTRVFEPEGAIEISLANEVVETWRVEDLAERPVAGAEVVVYGPGVDGFPRRRHVTNELGTFRAAFGHADTILVNAEGFAVACLDDLPGKRPRVVVLHPGFPLAGRVCAAGGAPVEGAEVILAADNWRERRIAGAGGAFRFEGLAGDGSAWIGVTAPGFAGAEVWPEPGREDLVLVLPEPGTVPRAGDGPPAGSVPVREVLPDAVRAERTRFDVVRLPDRTDVCFELDESRMEEEGVNVLTGLPPGEYEIQSEFGVKERIPLQLIEKVVPRFRAGARVRVEAGKESPLVTLRLESIGHSYACIRVLDAAGKPAEDVRLHCETPGLGRFTDDHQWYTRASGRIVAAVEAPPGTTVTYTAYPYSRHAGVPATAEVQTVAAASGPFTDLALRPGARLSVRVLSTGGEPLPEEDRLLLEVLQDGWPEWRGGPVQVYSGPGSSGPFEVSLLPDRAFTVRVFSLRHAARLERFPPPGPGRREVEVRLRMGAGLTARLLTPAGAPPGPVDIRVLDREGRNVARAPMSRGDGTIRIGCLPAGPATLVAQCHDRLLVAVRDVRLTAGEDSDLGDVTMDPLPRYRGVVLGIDGSPAAGVEIAVREGNARGDLMRTVTRGDGSFEVALPISDEPVLVARAPGGSAKAMVSLLDETTIQVRLEAVAEVFARFESPVRIRASEPDLVVETAGGIRCFPRRLPAWTADGLLEGYRLLQVPPGALVIRFEGRLVNGDPFAAKAWVVVKPGETTETLFR